MKTTEKLQQELATLKEAEKSCEKQIKLFIEVVAEEQVKLKAFQERINHIEEVLKNSKIEI